MFHHHLVTERIKDYTSNWFHHPRDKIQHEHRIHMLRDRCEHRQLFFKKQLGTQTGAKEYVLNKCEEIAESALRDVLKEHNVLCRTARPFGASERTDSKKNA